MTTAVPPVAQVQTLTLANFKGFRGATQLDLDAHVVLLTGRNGYGKTSVIEALELLFTGRCVDRRDPAGGAKAADWSRFINRSSGADRAQVDGVVRLSLPGAPCVTIDATVGRDSPPQVSTAHTLQDAGIVCACEDGPEADFLRDLTFYYQDGLNALMRLDTRTQAMLVDRFVPIPDLLGAFPAPFGRAGDRIVKTLAHESRRTEADIRKDRVAAQTRLSDALKPLDAPYDQGRFHNIQDATVTKRLGDLARALSVEVDIAGPTDWSTALRLIAAAARRRSVEPPMSEASVLTADSPPRALSELVDPSPSPAALTCRLGESRSRSDIESDVAASESEVEALDLRLIFLWRAGAPVPAHHAEYLEPCPGGALPLLNALAAVADHGQARLRQLQTMPEAVRNVIRDLLGAVKPSAVEAARLEAEAHYVALRRSHAEAATRLRAARDELEQLRALERLARRYASISGWLSGRHQRLDDFVQQLDPDWLDLGALREAAGAPDSQAAEVHAARWREVATAGDEWATTEEELAAHLNAPNAETTRHREALLALCRSMGPADSRPRGTTDFASTVRRRVLQDQHVTELNRALRRVLSRFALHYSLRRSIEMRPDPTKGIEYHVPDLETSSDARTERSFSTGQLNALAISLAIALNLNRHGHPFGFMCFDDVSSAFDLDNLACDAAVIRALAYGPDPARRRQVILATHHDELTTRLLPLLRPPRGHRLKVVQFTDWSRSAGAQVEQWECVAGEGDPEQVVRLLRSGGAT